MSAFDKYRQLDTIINSVHNIEVVKFDGEWIHVKLLASGSYLLVKPYTEFNVHNHDTVITSKDFGIKSKTINAFDLPKVLNKLKGF